MSISSSTYNNNNNNTDDDDHNVNKETKAIDNEEDDLLDWDDDDFDLSEIPQERLHHANTPDCPTSENTASEDDGNDDGNGINDSDGNEDEWLTPRKEEGKKFCASEKRNKEKKKKHRDGDSFEVYLTDQFCRLNTPASRKKSRCAICTRPIPELKYSGENDTVRFCMSCDNNVHSKKQTRNKKRVRFSEVVEVFM